MMFSFFLITLFACSSTKGVGGKGNPVKFKKKIEKVTRVDFQNKTRTVLMNKHQYIFIRNEDSEGQQYIETDWRYRSPFTDELESGIIEVRSKIILTAYPRELTNPQGLWVTTMEGINEVKLESTTTFVTLPMTNLTKKYFDRIADDLDLEFKTGIRSF